MTHPKFGWSSFSGLLPHPLGRIQKKLLSTETGSCDGTVHAGLLRRKRRYPPPSPSIISIIKACASLRIKYTAYCAVKRIGKSHSGDGRCCARLRISPSNGPMEGGRRPSRTQRNLITAWQQRLVGSTLQLQVKANGRVDNVDLEGTKHKSPTGARH